MSEAFGNIRNREVKSQYRQEVAHSRNPRAQEEFRRLMNVPEVLNVHVNESKKNLLFLERFFLSNKKLTFEKENMIVFNTFLNFNLFNFIVVIFL